MVYSSGSSIFGLRFRNYLPVGSDNNHEITFCFRVYLVSFDNSPLVRFKSFRNTWFSDFYSLGKILQRQGNWEIAVFSYCFSSLCPILATYSSRWRWSESVASFQGHVASPSHPLEGLRHANHTERLITIKFEISRASNFSLTLSSIAFKLLQVFALPWHRSLYCIVLHNWFALQSSSLLLLLGTSEGMNPRFV